MSPARPAEFRAHWHALKARFDAEAPPLVGRFFGELPARDVTLIERLVVDGKTARGCLVCLICEALGGTFEAALPRAVAVECIQAASLVHDDFVDSDATRRERPAMWTVLGPRRAVLLGDLMFATAIAQGARLSLADVITLTEAIATVASGAYHEPLDARELAATTAQSAGAVSFYERVIHCKTGALFGAAGKLGAIAAGADAECVSAACAFATRIGEAYQMTDDAEDLLGASGVDDWPAQKAAALATVRAHFAGSDAIRTRSHSMQDGAPDALKTDGSRGLKSRLEREIDHRLGLARQALAAFPLGARAASLHAAPAFIVMLLGSRS